MSPIRKTVLLIAFVALLLTAPLAFTESTAPQTPVASEEPAPVAYAYVQTIQGVVAYSAAANGRLTQIPSSPFATLGQLVGGDGKYLITIADYAIHAYAVEPNGAIGKLVSSIYTSAYAPASCPDAATSNANLDHTGRELYVEFGLPGSCQYLQTFYIAADSGALTYRGTTKAQNVPYPDYCSIDLTLTGNNRFAYIATGAGVSPPVGAFVRNSNGALESLSKFSERDPELPIPGGVWWPYNMQADPTNHLAVSLGEFDQVSGDLISPFVIASYTVDAEGNISSKNTAADMAVSPVIPENLSMSPSGKFLAVAGSNSYYLDGEEYNVGGLEIYHFNGADPLTPYDTNIPLDGAAYLIKWDNDNHLYATDNRLHVFTVTSESITEAPGSPYPLPPVCSGDTCVWNLTVVSRPLASQPSDPR